MIMIRAVAWITLLAALAVPAAAHDIDLHRLPLGDGIGTCHTNPNGGGAFRDRLWIGRKAGTFDLTRQTAVSGSVR
jgi:hypothetical protein